MIAETGSILMNPIQKNNQAIFRMLLMSEKKIVPPIPREKIMAMSDKELKAEHNFLLNLLKDNPGDDVIIEDLENINKEIKCREMNKYL